MNNVLDYPIRHTMIQQWGLFPLVAVFLFFGSSQMDSFKQSMDKVKRDLPYVKVRLNGRTFDGKLSGRLNEQATVSLGYSTSLRDWVDFHFSWETVTRAVLENRTLRAD